MHSLITSLPHFFCSWVCVEGCGRQHHHYCQRKQKNRKNGVGLGTRLVGAHVVHTCQVNLDEHKALLHHSQCWVGRGLAKQAASLLRSSYWYAQAIELNQMWEATHHQLHAHIKHHTSETARCFPKFTQLRLPVYQHKLGQQPCH